MKNLKLVKDMTIEEQAQLLSKRIKNFENRSFRALSSSGIIWIDQDNGSAYQIIDSKTVSKLN